MLAEVSQAVDEALHVQRVDEANGADPEKSCPAKQRAAEYGNHDHRNFGAGPEFVDATGEFGTVLHLVGRLRLIKPAEMRPPEAAVGGAGNVVGTVGVDVMVTMIGDPAARRAGSIKHRPEDQH